MLAVKRIKMFSYQPKKNIFFLPAVKKIFKCQVRRELPLGLVPGGSGNAVHCSLLHQLAESFDDEVGESFDDEAK